MRIIFVHLDNRSNDLGVSDYKNVIVVQFRSPIKLGEDIIEECVYFLFGELAELFIDLDEFYKFFSSFLVKGGHLRFCKLWLTMVTLKFIKTKHKK